MTERARCQLERLTAACDGHDLRVHTDETLVPSQWMEAYHRICVVPQMKSDLVRLAALRTHGGIYFDVDVTLLASVNAICAHMPNTYCAVHIKPGQFFGGDILSCPAAWDGWGAVDEYVAGVTSSTQLPAFVQFTHALTAFLMRRRLAHVLSNARLWPTRPQDLSADALVCRGFDCHAATGLGDMVASALSAVGITKERVSKALGKDCGCAKRQAALNDLGRRLGIG